MGKCVVLGSMLALLSFPFLNAQDTRTVREPVFPPACATLAARLSTSGDSIAESDEANRDYESPLDTGRIQHALDACGRGHAVVLRADGVNDAFLSGPLSLRTGVTLIVDKGVTLFASRNPAVYETSPGSCGVIKKPAKPMASVPITGCKPLISADHVSGAGVMGDGTIDGRGGSKLLRQKITWWGLAELTRPGYGQQVPRLIVADYADNFTLYRITLKNSPNAHVVYDHGNGFTAWGVKIDTPKRQARNTDGIDPGDGSKNITITHSYIRAGDDNIAIKGGPGGVTNMTVSHSHFYWGHGMAIGSETVGGVSKIRVFDLSLDGPDNGIRIKSNGSRGGLVHDVVFDDVCVRNSANPIVLDTAYASGGDLRGNFPPVMRDITLHNVRVSGGGKISFNGYSHKYRVQANLDGVWLTDHANYTYSLNHADLHLGPGPVNLKFPTGADSTVRGTPAGGGKPASCAAMFVPFPVQ